MELTEKIRNELKEALNRVDVAEIGTLEEAPEALRLPNVLRSTLLPMIIEREEQAYIEVILVWGAEHGLDVRLLDADKIREVAGKATPQPVCRMPLPKAVTIGATTFGAGTAVLGHCPRCGEWVKPPWNYCPACGQAVVFGKEGDGTIC